LVFAKFEFPIFMKNPVWNSSYAVTIYTKF